MGDIRVIIVPDGPAKIECDRAEIVLADGRVISKEKKFSLCRCGETDDKPFCDGSHNICGFHG